MTKIVQLQVENIKRIRALTITPDGNVVVVGGKNGQGKSSTLDAIWYALGGAGALPTEPLRQGETDGFSRVVLDNGLTITRRVLESGNTSLKVETADGVLKSPQAILDRMVGSISFDPMAFSRMEPKAQLETLRQLVGVDTNDLDNKRAEVYTKRTQVNVRLREIDAKLGERRPDVKLPDEEVSVADLMNQLDVVTQHQDDFSGLIEDDEKADDEYTELGEEIIDTELRLKRLKEQRTELVRSIKKRKKLIGDTRSETGAALQLAVDEVKERINKADSVNATIRENAVLIDLVDRLSKGKQMSKELTAEITKIDAAKETRIAKAKFPVKGLAFGETGVRFNDVPFEQCSSAEQTRVSVGMALAMNPDLRVLLIRDGSLLDEDSFALVAKMAEKADAQVWIETVTTDSEKCAVIIEDGEVRSTKNTGGGGDVDEKPHDANTGGGGGVDETR